MPLSSGTRLGSYEILSAIGAGGMGEVYKARDTRLQRTVAIKVMPAEVASDPQFRDRFEHEARTVSQLDHPHICALYDVGEERGTSFIVMQFLEGETLADRLTRGALPLEEALRYANEIADALDKAHRMGIVHRDVKPGNIMLTKTGATLLDFGLAKSGVPVLASSGMSMLPTTPVANLTAVGTILGTFQYMAPEQLEGREADARTDIFALGAVLYEMLTGRKAFEGKSQATLIAAIVGSEPPPVSTLQPIAPPLLDDVVRTCLAKDPVARWQSASDLGRALALATKHQPMAASVPSPSPRGRSARLAWSITVLVLAAGATVAAWFWSGRTTPIPAQVLFEVDTGVSPSPLQLAASPDGTRLVSIATSQANAVLWLRRLDQVAPQILAGTAGATFPFWSAESRFIAFFANGKLNKIDIFGGPPQALCDAPGGIGGTWNRSGVILFAPAAAGPLFRVSSDGGLPVQETELDASRGDIAHRHPKFLPDGQHFIFLLLSNKLANSGLYLGTLGSKAMTRLIASDAMGAFAAPDHILFMRSSTLLAQRFDPDRLALEGEPFPVANDVGINTANSVAGFAVSDNGILTTRVGGGNGERVLRWVDRNGKALGDVAGSGPHESVAVSPDGGRLADVRLEGATGDVWISDLTRGTSARFTFDPAPDDHPIWSPDAGRIVFDSGRDGEVRQLFVKSSGGAGKEELLLKTDGSKIPTDWSRDGRYILYTDTKNRTDVWVLPMTGDRKPFPFLTSEFNENRARFSPDGRWIAYSSDESGGYQIYVQPFPPSGGKWQISTDGGAEPHWSSNGRELFYSVGGGVWSVEVNGAGSTFVAGVPKKLFDSTLAPGAFITRFDIAQAGQRFLLNLNAINASATPSIRVVLNWMTGLEQ